MSKALTPEQKEKLAAYKRNYRANNSEKHRDCNKAWRASNPDLVKQQKIRRRDRLALQGPEITRAQPAKEPLSGTTYDRNDRAYNREEMIKVFKGLYKNNKEAILLLFPCLSRSAMHKRARVYGVAGTWVRWSDDDNKVIMKLWPDKKAIQDNIRSRRNIWNIEAQGAKLGLTKAEFHKKWTRNEDDLLKSGQRPLGRSGASCEHRFRVLGLRRKDLQLAHQISGEDLHTIIRQSISRGLPRHIREDAEADLLLAVMDGKVAPNRDAIRAAAKKAVTTVYKMHPDRGAPTSLDAKIFDDGTSTVGDRIASDTFHF